MIEHQTLPVDVNSASTILGTRAVSPSYKYSHVAPGTYCTSKVSCVLSRFSLETWTRIGREACATPGQFYLSRDFGDLGMIDGVGHP